MIDGHVYIHRQMLRHSCDQLSKMSIWVNTTFKGNIRTFPERWVKHILAFASAQMPSSTEVNLFLWYCLVYKYNYSTMSKQRTPGKYWYRLTVFLMISWHLIAWLSLVWLLNILMAWLSLVWLLNILMAAPSTWSIHGWPWQWHWSWASPVVCYITSPADCIVLSHFKGHFNGKDQSCCACLP